MHFIKFSQLIKEDQVDPELAKKVQKEFDEGDDECPRCGKQEHECICGEQDYGSTVNLQRLNKGKVNAPDNKFKSD